MSNPTYRFSVGPWNLGRGADPFGPPVRPAVPFAEVLDTAVRLGFEGIQFHDDDAVPRLENLPPAKIVQEAEAIRGLAIPILGVSGGSGWYDSSSGIPSISTDNAAIGRLGYGRWNGRRPPAEPRETQIFWSDSPSPGGRSAIYNGGVR